jgi:predicted secreted protein
MTQAILVTLFCCLPLGIVSIMKANEVNRRLLANDYAGAVQASNSNRTMLWIGFSVGLVISVIYILVTVANNS